MLACSNFANPLLNSGGSNFWKHMRETPDACSRQSVLACFLKKPCQMFAMCALKCIQYWALSINSFTFVFIRDFLCPLQRSFSNYGLMWLFNLSSACANSQRPHAEWNQRGAAFNIHLFELIQYKRCVVLSRNEWRHFTRFEELLLVDYC